MDIGDTNLPGDDREVEFWSLKTVSGYDVLTYMGKRSDPTAQARQSGTSNLAAIYLAVVRSIKPPPGYGFNHRTIIKDSIYIGLLNQEELTHRIDYGIRLQNPERVEVSVIRNWLHRCDSHATCHEISPASGCGLTLKVLDTERLQVVDLPQSSA